MRSGFEKSPWCRMWTSPRKTIRSIVSANPSMQLLPLSIVYGFPIMIHMAGFLNMGASFNIWGTLLISLLLSPIVGFIGISFTSIIVYWAGKLVKGRSRYKELRCAVAWSNVPNVVTCVAWVLLAIFVGGALFTPGFYSEGMALPAITTLLFGLQAIAAVWAFVLFLIALSAVQRFSIWRAIVNVLIPFVLLFLLSEGLNLIVK
jgi:hypothetical protein